MAHDGALARMVEQVGEAAELGFKAHAHMLPHACGFALANEGHAELSPDRLEDSWRR